jgi:MurNAc alpha-1-phosphate uridylyltransferase
MKRFNRSATCWNNYQSRRLHDRAPAYGYGMKVMILAAGRGQRMRELTENCPKPLLKIGNKPIIVHLIEQLRSAGLTDLVINHAWQGQQLLDTLGNGQDWGVELSWSAENTALETAGGIANALPLLGAEPFAVVNGDILTDYRFADLADRGKEIKDRNLLAGCLLVSNPRHHPQGDFAIDAAGLLATAGPNKMTFAGIGVYSPETFNAVKPGEPAPLGPLLRELADRGKVAAWQHAGIWSDIGTPERLDDATQLLASIEANRAARKA